MWKKYVTRRLATQVAQAWNFGWGKAMEQIYGTSVLNTLVFRDDKKTEYYVDAKQYEVYVQHLYSLLGNEMFLRLFHKEAKATLENILMQVKRKLRQDLSKLSNAELLELYQNFILPKVEQFYIRMWTVFNIGEPLAETVKGKLSHYIQNEEELSESLLILSSPLVHNDVQRERIELLKLLAESNGGTPKQIIGRLQKHLDHFRHIPMFEFDHEPYSVEQIMKEIELIKNPKQELVEIVERAKEKKAKYDWLIKKINPQAELMLPLEFLQENVFLRDYRDMIRQKLNLELRQLYQEIGRRLGLNITEVATLTNEEIVAYLTQGKLFSGEEVRKRKEAYLLIQKGKVVGICSGKEAMDKMQRELGWGKIIEVDQIIKGMIGSKGKACGLAKIIFTNKDLGKVKQGDVMIATMTRQDFVPALRLASALVTDEGSITCHAAIIARELGIPCLVATKNATQVVRDGDLVEVDAIKGILKKIND
jgi:phosphohistidine swiveling domain-containing protein